jgi:hypothetical protein
MSESVNRLGASSSLPTCVIRALGRAVDCNMDTSSHHLPLEGEVYTNGRRKP